MHAAIPKWTDRGHMFTCCCKWTAEEVKSECSVVCVCVCVHAHACVDRVSLSGSTAKCVTDGVMEDESTATCRQTSLFFRLICSALFPPCFRDFIVFHLLMISFFFSPCHYWALFPLLFLYIISRLQLLLIRFLLFSMLTFSPFFLIILLNFYLPTYLPTYLLPSYLPTYPPPLPSTGTHYTSLRWFRRIFWSWGSESSSHQLRANRARSE